MEAKPLGQRPVGRPRTTCEEWVKHIMVSREKKISQIGRLVRDRLEF